MAESWIQGRKVLEQDGCWHWFNTNWSPQSALHCEEGKCIQCKQLNYDVAWLWNNSIALQLYMKQQAVQKHGCKVVLRRGGPWARPLSQSSTPIQSAPLCSGLGLPALLWSVLVCFALVWGDVFNASATTGESSFSLQQKEKSAQSQRKADL